jgi:hypothetical protein
MESGPMADDSHSPGGSKTGIAPHANVRPGRGKWIGGTGKFDLNRPDRLHGILLLVLCSAALGGCVSLRPTGPPAIADEWELVGPFRHFSRRARASQPTSRKEDRRRPAATSQPASQPADSLWSIPAEDPEWFDDSFSLSRIPPGLFASVSSQDDKFWYLDIGFRSGYTRLESTADRLQTRLDLPLKLDVFGMFESPYTPMDRKSDFALTTQYIGIGRRETDWLTWNFYFGFGIGGDRNKQRFANANLEVNFEYAAYYTGLTADIYPWGIPKDRNYVNAKERMKASRPFLLTGFELGYIRARGWGDFSLAPLEIYSDSQYVEDWLFGWLAGAGWEFPIANNWAFHLSGHYTFHAYRPDEYNGFNMVGTLRYRF